MKQLQSLRGRSRQTPSTGLIPRFTPSSSEIELLITRAEGHPLGVDFLRQGALDAVAAAFQVHAFVVEHARERLVR